MREIDKGIIIQTEFFVDLPRQVKAGQGICCTIRAVSLNQGHTQFHVRQRDLRKTLKTTHGQSTRGMIKRDFMLSAETCGQDYRTILSAT